MTVPRGDMVPFAWHHMALRVPEHWELIGFKKNPRDGRVVLADRNGETLQAFWKIIRQTPAVRQLLTSLVSKLTEGRISPTEARRSIKEIAGWHVAMPREPELPLFAARWHESQRVLLNFTFPPHPDTAVRARVHEILASWQPNDGPDRLWAAFGLEFTLPEAWRLDEVTALPACQVMRFEDRKGQTVAIHRYGMMPAILQGEDMPTFFARVRGRGAMLRRTGTFTKEGRHEGAELSYETRGKSGWSMLARTWQGRVWLWRRDDLKRLYAIDHHAMKKHFIWDLAERVRGR